MKKLFLIIVFGLIISLTSCSQKTFNNYHVGKIDYYISGFYLKYHDHLAEINDNNPKVFFDYTNNMFSAIISSGENSNYKFVETKKTIEDLDGVVVLYFDLTLIIPLKSNSLIECYLITQSTDGKFIINTKIKEEFNYKLIPNYILNSTFSTGSIDYDLKINLKLDVRS